ncbi:iron-sulfur protein [Corynebacterium sp. HMSC058E07]|uniref:Rieske (2Fe-2S) protein n=1 Tax=Corynebacterium TaxID=1716 RepID=UPI000558BBA4|nr:Rieske (2Fe-2S) protein [Corynebacterium sp. HMSC058E07]OFM55507.1 iron-sulfur protein [Corynebacterium sp. HMSC058E07]
MSTSQPNTPLSCSRRSFLRGMAVATATTASGALLAACAGEEVVAKADAADLEVGGATILDGWVLSRPGENEYKAFSTSCPHAGGTINSIEKAGDVTVAVCPKHGSKFDVATGDVVEGPSRDPMSPAKKVERNGDSIEITN